MRLNYDSALTIDLGSIFEIEKWVVYKRFAARNGRKITLRSFMWEDLDGALAFVNGIVAERSEDPNLGILIDEKMTR